MQVGFARQARAHPAIGRGRKFDVARKRANVKTRSARDDTASSAARGSANRTERVAREARRIVAFRGVEKRNEMMRDAREFFGGRRGGADRHAAIDLPGIRADDLGVEPLGQLDRKRGLSGARGPRENQDAVDPVRGYGPSTTRTK